MQNNWIENLEYILNDAELREFVLTILAGIGGYHIFMSMRNGDVEKEASTQNLDLDDLLKVASLMNMADIQRSVNAVGGHQGINEDALNKMKVTAQALEERFSRLEALYNQLVEDKQDETTKT